MANSKIVLAVLLSLLVYGAFGYRESQSRSSRYRYKQREAQQCRLQQLTTSRPSQRIQAEGGVVEFWDENEEQFQCAGAAAMRIKMQPSSMALPKFHSAPRLVYIKQGMGVMGMTCPGCPETYHSSQRTSMGMQAQSQRDQHQKIHRIRQEDIIAIPAGEAYWCYNDGNEELITVSVFNLNNQANQLDQILRTFFLAGGQWRSQMQEQRPKGSHQMLENIFSGFDTEMLAEAFNVSSSTVRKMQRDSRGPIVKVGDEMRIIRPDEEEEERMYEGRGPWNQTDDTLCTMKIKYNMNTRTEADIVVRQGGRVTMVNQEKLPILRLLDMSSNRGLLMPNAMVAPHWSMTDNRVVYVTRGEAHVQVVDNFGNTIMDERVKEGDMFVLPQFYASMAKASSNGYEWVTFTTSSKPMISPLAGNASVTKAMPIEVLTNAYRNMSPREAQEIKWNRGQQTMLLSPGRRIYH